MNEWVDAKYWMQGYSYFRNTLHWCIIIRCASWNNVLTISFSLKTLTFNGYPVFPCRFDSIDPRNEFLGLKIVEIELSFMKFGPRIRFLVDFYPTRRLSRGPGPLEIYEGPGDKEDGPQKIAKKISELSTIIGTTY